jgi:hypothetical protein
VFGADEVLLLHSAAQTYWEQGVFWGRLGLFQGELLRDLSITTCALGTPYKVIKARDD